MHYLQILKIFIILLALFLGGAAHFNLLSTHCKGVYFLGFSTRQVLFNNEPLVPPFSETIKTYHLISLNTFLPNTLTSDYFKKTYRLNAINPDDYLIFFVGLKAYKINLYNTEIMPSYQVKTTPDVSPGYYFLTPFNGRNCSKSYAMIVDEKGALRYYRRNRTDNRCVSDFKKIVTTDNKVRFTLMEQEKPMPPTAYHAGALMVLDENFEPFKRLYLKPYGNHGQLQTENHESLYFNDHHYILSGYWETEVYDPETDEPIFVAATVIQEIKNDKVVYEFNSTDYPQFLKTSIFPKPRAGYWDYMHYNSIAVDPKDGNWILSFANQFSLVKIDKTRGGGYLGLWAEKRICLIFKSRKTILLSSTNLSSLTKTHFYYLTITTIVTLSLRQSNHLTHDYFLLLSMKKIIKFQIIGKFRYNAPAAWEMFIKQTTARLFFRAEANLLRVA